jgi:hypothetical protein
MQARELRIGNWLRFDNMISKPYNTQVYPRMFRQLGMDLSENLNLELSPYHQPIPLTEQWLLDFGFEFRIDTNVWWSTDDILCYSNGYIGFPTTCYTKIDHVHDLQNYYFSVLGKELELKQLQK